MNKTACQQQEQFEGEPLVFSTQALCCGGMQGRGILLQT